MVDYFDWNQFGTGAADFYTKGSPAGAWAGGNSGLPLEQAVMQGTTLFKQNFKTQTGRDPTPDEIGAFQIQALPSALGSNSGSLGYGDMTGIANSFIQNQYGPEVAKYQQQQQATQLSSSQDLVQNLINKTMGNTASQFSDPNSSVYQSFSGGMNNLGISPSSGAFQAGAGSTIANAGLDASNSALASIGIPAISGIQNLSSAPYQSSISSGSSALTDLNNVRDFNMQAQLAKILGDEGQPSSSQNILGMASGSAQGAGSLLQGGAQAYKATWICSAMKKAGVLSGEEIDGLHDHLFKAFWKRPFKFLGYFIFGKLLVFVAERNNTDWRIWKSEFYNKVMAESDPVKALDLYEEAFWHLHANVRIRQRVLVR